MTEWKTYRLKDVTSILGDGLHGTPVYDETGDVFFINGNNLENGHINIKSNTKRVSTEEAAKYRKPLNDRTILVSINGTIGNVGKYNNENCILGKSACYFNVAEDFDYDFIYYVIANDIFKNTISRLATGTTIKNVSLETMRNYTFCAPDITTQRRISKILGAIDDKIENNRHINTNLELQAQALYKQWFVDFDFPNEDGKPYKSSGGKMVDSELGLIPEGWSVGKLEDVGTIVGGGTPSKAKQEYYTSNGIAWITPKDLSITHAKFTAKGEVDITDIGYANSSAKMMPRGSILFSSRAPIGYISIAKNDICTNQGFKSVVPNNGCTAFVYYFLLSNTENIESKATGSTFKEASGALMKSLELVIPSDDILEKFENIMSPIFESQEKFEAENETLAILRDTLLPKLMNGEIKVAE